MHSFLNADTPKSLTLINNCDDWLTITVYTDVSVARVKTGFLSNCSFTLISRNTVKLRLSGTGGLTMVDDEDFFPTVMLAY